MSNIVCFLSICSNNPEKSLYSLKQTSGSLLGKQKVSFIDKDYSGINPESIPIPEYYRVNRLQN